MDELLTQYILDTFYLGTLKEPPITVNGGITNSIYKLITDKDVYAIKIINKSKIEQDKNLINKIELSENISFKALINGIDSVVALKFKDKYVNEYNGIHFLIYKWCNGSVLLSKEITTFHLKTLANALAQLHKIEVDKNIKVLKYEKIDYSYYYNLLKDNEEDWAIKFKSNFERLTEIYNVVYNNYIKLSNQLSYVHKDLNRKNVIWNEDKYNIIDWETSTVSNPILDFFNSAWFLTEDISEDKFKVFTEEYLKNMKLDDDLVTGINSAIIEECQWLEFSLKRALGINSKDVNEIKLGINSIESSLKEIINYYDKIPLMISYLNI